MNGNSQANVGVHQTLDAMLLTPALFVLPSIPVYTNVGWFQYQLVRIELKMGLIFRTKTGIGVFFLLNTHNQI
jgi:hypothetical protein